MGSILGQTEKMFADDKSLVVEVTVVRLANPGYQARLTSDEKIKKNVLSEQRPGVIGTP